MTTDFRGIPLPDYLEEPWYTAYDNALKFLIDAVKGTDEGTLPINSLLAKLRQNESLNLFDYTNITDDFRIDHTTGDLIASVGDSASDFIPIEETKNYKKTQSKPFAWYDASKVYISGLFSTGSSNMQPPAGAAFVRITTLTSTKDTEMLTQVWVDNAVYIPFDGYRLKTEALSQKYDNCAILKSTNMIDLNNIEYGVRYSTVDGTKTTGDFAWTGKIFVTPEQWYTWRTTGNLGTNWVAWDSGDSFVESAVTTNIFKPSANVSYIRLKINNAADLMVAVILQGKNRSDIYINPTKSYINVNNINNAVMSKWSRKNWWVLGDSISTGDGVTGSFAIKPYHVLLGHEREIYVNSIAVSGRKISGSDSNDINQQITNGKMPTTANAPDVVTIWGGTNDFGFNIPLGISTDMTNATFYGAVNKTINDMHDTFPGTPFGFITPIPRSTDNPNAVGAYLHEYVDIIIEACRNYNVPCLDLFYGGGIYLANSNVDTEWSGDGLHPNDACHEAILKGKIGTFLESL